VNIAFTITYPDGRTAKTSGVSDAFGSFSGPQKFLLDTPGVYQYTIDASWNGYPAADAGAARHRAATSTCWEAAAAGRGPRGFRF